MCVWFRLVSSLRILQETRYSRIPVYSGEIDRISGVVLSKDLLDFVQVCRGWDAGTGTGKGGGG